MINKIKKFFNKKFNKTTNNNESIVIDKVIEINNEISYLIPNYLSLYKPVNDQLNISYNPFNNLLPHITNNIITEFEFLSYLKTNKNNLDISYIKGWVIFIFFK